MRKASLKIWAQNQSFKKLRHCFVDEKRNDYNNINIFLSLENPCIFLLAREKTRKRIFNTNSELSQNHTDFPFEGTLNWLFNDI